MITAIVQLGKDIDGEAAGDESGYSVSLSHDGNTVAIGAIWHDKDPGDDRGHVRVYRYNDIDTWKKIGDITGEAAGDWSGYSVSLSHDGNTVAIGAILHDEDFEVNANANDNRGHVRVYRYNDIDTWKKIGDITGEAAGDWSGYSVSLSHDGNTVAIGAILHDDRGQVRVYKYNGIDEWVEIGDIDGEAAGDESGYSVSLSHDGNTVAIGTILDFEVNPNDNRGHVRVYRYISIGNWEEIGYITGEAAGDQSGFSVSLSHHGNTVAIGAILHDYRGHVRVYKYNGIDEWDKIGDIDGDAAGDWSGYSVSLSHDGNTVAIGAVLHDEDFEVNANDNRGHVRVYKYNGIDEWDKIGDIDGDAASDWSGYSVSLSHDGNTVAIGAVLHGEDGVVNPNDNRGHVRVYSLIPIINRDFTTKEQAAIVLGAILTEKVSEKKNVKGVFQDRLLERGLVGGGISYGLGLVYERMEREKIVDIVGNKYTIKKTSKGKNKLALEGVLGTVIRKLLIP